MRLRELARILVLVVLLAGLSTGCGGGDQSSNQSNNGAQNGGAPSGKEEGGKVVKKKVPKAKVVFGTVKTVNPDKKRIVLRPNSEIQGDKRMFFKVDKKTEINVDDKEADLVDAKKGQQARIEYVVVKMKERERNRARAVEVFSAD